MKKNMGLADLIIRVIMAAGFIFLCATKVETGLGATMLIVFAAVFLLTSAIGNCPVYSLFDFDTRRKRSGVH